jgi:hypothetical protein
MVPSMSNYKGVNNADIAKAEGQNILSFLASGINKEAPIIKALFFGSGDNNEEGAIANEFADLLEFIDFHTRNNDVRGHIRSLDEQQEEEKNPNSRDTSLDLTVKLFTGERRKVFDSDDVVLRRLLAITERKKDKFWGTGQNMKSVFETFFEGITCYIAEGTSKDNLLGDGDFVNSEDETDWVRHGAKITHEARFSKLHGVLLQGADESVELPNTCTTTTGELESGGYTLHFMLKGKCGVIIQNGKKRYWNANEQKCTGGTVLQWENDEFINEFQSGKKESTKDTTEYSWMNEYEWINASCFIYLSEPTALTIQFISIEDSPAAIDYVRLFEKPWYPSYTLILNYSGSNVGAGILHLGIGSKDNIDGIDYEKESYFDHTYLSGAIAVQQINAFYVLLEKVRPRGIEAFIEFAEKQEVVKEEGG